jgi:hypothetical protein
MKNHLKPLADALLPYSYSVMSHDDKKMILRAGNGAEVTFELLKMSPMTASLAAGDEWASRQVADLLQSHPAFTFIREPEGDIPWKIEFKGAAVENFATVRNALFESDKKEEEPKKVPDSLDRLINGIIQNTEMYDTFMLKDMPRERLEQLYRKHVLNEGINAGGQEVPPEVTEVYQTAMESGAEYGRMYEKEMGEEFGIKPEEMVYVHREDNPESSDFESWLVGPNYEQLAGFSLIYRPDGSWAYRVHYGEGPDSPIPHSEALGNAELMFHG